MNVLIFLLAVLVVFCGQEPTSSTTLVSYLESVSWVGSDGGRGRVLSFPALCSSSKTCRDLLALRGGDSCSENEDVQGEERWGAESETPKGQDAFEIGSTIGQDVDRDQVARMSIADLKALFAKHGMTHLDDDAASKILAAAKKDIMVEDPSKVRDDPEVSAWTGRREDYLSEAQAEHTPQTKLPAMRRGFLTSPGSGAKKASIVHQSPTRSSPVLVTPSPTRFKEGDRSPGSGKASTPRRKSKVKEAQQDFDLADLEQLNQKMSEIQLKEAFVPEMVRSPRPLDEDTQMREEEDDDDEEEEEEEEEAGAEEEEDDGTSSEGLSSEELDAKGSEELDSLVQAELRKIEKRFGLRRKPNISHPLLRGEISWAEFEKQEAKKGMGGMFWRSHLLATYAKNESQGLDLVDQIPFRGNPDESLFPPSKGVGDNVNATREREEALLTQLLDAVFEDDATEIERLHREEAANINLRDFTTETDAATPLQYAIEHHCYNAAFKLLELGADVHKPDRLGVTPLFYCAAHNGSRVAKELLLRGADAAYVDTSTGSSALHVAAGEGDNEMVKLLVEEGGADVNARDELHWETPLFDAAANGWTDTCLLLIQLGADPCAKDKINYQPYLCAQDWDRWETAQALIEAMGSNYTKLAVNEYPQPPGRAPRPGELTRKPVPGDSDYSNDEFFMGGKVEDEEEELDEEIEGSQMMAAAVNHSKTEEAERRKRAKERRANQALVSSLD